MSFFPGKDPTTGDRYACDALETVAGKPCSAPAVDGRTRCRMHGGAQGSGAPTGNQNAVKHGLHTKAAIEERKQLRTLMRDARKLLHGIA